MGNLSDDLREGLDKWRWHRLGPFFPTTPAPKELTSALPPDFMVAIQEFGGCEGFLGKVYLRLYRLEELAGVNQAYMVGEYAPEIIVFGSNGGGDVFAFIAENGAIVQVPAIPLSLEYAHQMAAGFSEFIAFLAATGESSETRGEALGKEVHEIKPVVFGGDPRDLANKVLVEPPIHAQAAIFWNKVYKQAKKNLKSS